MRERVLSNIVSQATNDRNRLESQTLIEELKNNISERSDISEEAKQKLLERIK